MKRSGPLKRSPMPRSTKPMKRSRLAPMSEKRREQIPARQACVAAVIKRDGGCLFWRRFNDSGGEARDLLRLCPPGLQVSRCSYPWVLDAHEPARRSHGADPTNPDECVCLCRYHHTYVHEHPAIGRLLGLIT